MTARHWTLVVLIAVVAAAGGYFFARQNHAHAGGASADGGRRVAFYQSPMHPWIKSDRPGKCTICGMDLVPVYEGDTGHAQSSALVMLPPASASVIGMKTSEVARGNWVKTLRVNGVLEADETRRRVVSAHVPGRIEKLYVNEIGARVEAGQPLAMLYSPEVQTAQRQYVERFRAGPSAVTASELADARERLLAMGLLPHEIAELEETLRPQATVEVHAHAGGTIISRAAYVGQYVDTHDKIFEVADFSTLWFVFDAYEADLPDIREGLPVEVTVANGGEAMVAPITFVDPNMNPLNRTARVRVVLDNASGALKHGQLATGRVRIEKQDTLLVPRSAVLHTRARPVVFVEKGEGAYEPRTVTLGHAGDEAYAVIDGLRAGERVVTQGALLLDGQAQLAHATTESSHEHAHGHAAEKAPSTSADGIDAAQLEALVLAAADVSAALAADDLPGFQKMYPKLHDAFTKASSLPESLKTQGEKLVDGPDLKAARRAFEPFSTGLADLARAAHLHHRGVVKIFQCPMTPVLGVGRWVQRDAELRNPFFGSAMLECGEEIE